jgi:hypothetical protein
VTNEVGAKKSNKFLSLLVTGLQAVPKNLTRVRTMAGSPVVIAATAKHTATVRQFLSS